MALASATPASLRPAAWSLAIRFDATTAVSCAFLFYRPIIFSALTLCLTAAGWRSARPA